MAVLIIEYYAFEAGKNCKEQAIKTFRSFAAIGFRTYVQGKLGFKKSASDLAGEAITGIDKMLKGKVVWAFSDEPHQDLKNRMIDAKVNYCNLGVLQNFTLSKLMKLEEQIEDTRPKLVVVDSLYSISAGAVDLNTYEGGVAVRRLENLAKKYSCAMILIHHCAKDPQLKGITKIANSTSITAAVNGVYGFKKEGTGGKGGTFLSTYLRSFGSICFSAFSINAP